MKKCSILMLLFALLSCKDDPEPKPTVSFTSSVKENGIVEFKSISTGAMLLDWDFGDGKGASGESPTHEYLKNGTYDVKVTAKGSGGDAIAIGTVKVENVQGSVVFWMQSMRDKIIEVKINGQTSKISGFYSSGTAPACGANLCATFDRLKPGQYAFEAKELEAFLPTTWKGSVIVSQKGCVAQKLTY